MTDLEMTGLCADALGEHWQAMPDHYLIFRNTEKDGPHYIRYDPLNDPAQAIELLERFCLSVSGPYGSDPDRLWYVFKPMANAELVENKNLSRAIVECVAKVHAGVSAV